MNRFHHWASLWLPVVIWCGFIYFLSSIPHLATPWGIWDFILRKGAHLTEYAILASLFYRALRGSTSWSKTACFFAALGFVALYAASDEFHQLSVPGRHGSLRDVLIDTVGGYLGLRVVTTWNLI